MTTDWDQPCPNCGGNMMCTGNTRTEAQSGDCIECGYEFHTTYGQLSLEELNERRVDWELEPLKELPKVKPELLGLVEEGAQG